MDGWRPQWLCPGMCSVPDEFSESHQDLVAGRNTGKDVLYNFQLIYPHPVVAPERCIGAFPQNYFISPISSPLPNYNCVKIRPIWRFQHKNGKYSKFVHASNFSLFAPPPKKILMRVMPPKFWSNTQVSPGKGLYSTLEMIRQLWYLLSTSGEGGE